MAEETTSSESKTGNGAPAIRHRKQRLGVVIAANTPKTVVVMVTRRVRHPQYKKFITRRAKYAVHDLIGCEVGDRVRISETRPMSKTKRWRIVEKIAKDA